MWFLYFEPIRSPPNDQKHLIPDINWTIFFLTLVFADCISLVRHWQIHVFRASQRAFWLFSKSQKACCSYPFTYLRMQNSLVQFGAVPDHVPLARHWRVIEPMSKYPSMHEYMMEWEKVVPSRREMRPWVGVAGLLHCTAERQDRKVKDAKL